MHHSVHGCEWTQDLAHVYKYRYVYMDISKATSLLFKFIMAPKEKYTASSFRIPMPTAHKRRVLHPQGAEVVLAGRISWRTGMASVA